MRRHLTPTDLEHPICTGCGTQYAAAAEPPTSCRICTDDRQYVPRGGQAWTTHERLARAHRLRVEPDDGLLGVGVDGGFGIPQRALVVATGAGTILWDCVSLVTDEAIEAVGPVDLIAISHPHFYASMVEWSDAYGGIPILVHADDASWIARPAPQIETWSGRRHRLGPTAELLHLPGHFPGSAALHWTDAPDQRSALLTGDSLHVAADRRHVSVMHSVPNHVPVGPATIRELRKRLEGLHFDDVYGFTWGLNIIGGADDAVRQSLDRYLAAITD